MMLDIESSRCIQRCGFIAGCLLGVCLSLTSLPAMAAGMQDVDMAVRIKDYVRAAQLLEPLAEKGDAEAQYRLAGFYRMGTGVEKNHKAAVSWLRRAAQQGYVKAQYNLGVMYENGWGVPLDQIMAEQWFRKAAARDMTWLRPNCTI